MDKHARPAVTEALPDPEAPSINDLVALLHDRDPDRLADLRHRYPAHARLLRPGITLGVDAGELDVRIDVALEGLRVVQGRIEPNLQRLRDRLQRAQSLRLVGNAVAAAASAGLLAAVLADADMVTKVAAVVNFVAALCALFATHLETPLYGGTSNLVDVFERLTSTSAEAESIMEELKICQRANTDKDHCAELVKHANVIAAELRVAEKRLWGRRLSRA